MSLIIGVGFTQVTCCTCGIVYAIEDQYREKLLNKREDGETYCPNGHKWWYLGKSFDRQIDELKMRVQEKDNALCDERNKRARLEKRVQRGVCLYCKRTFPNLTRHMQCKHKKKLQP